jgi:hypothetical protein
MSSGNRAAVTHIQKGALKKYAMRNPVMEGYL